MESKLYEKVNNIFLSYFGSTIDDLMQFHLKNILESDSDTFNVIKAKNRFLKNVNDLITCYISVIPEHNPLYERSINDLNEFENLETYEKDLLDSRYFYYVDEAFDKKQNKTI